MISELALVTHKSRAATAYSVGKTKCAGKRECEILNKKGERGERDRLKNIWCYLWIHGDGGSSNIAEIKSELLTQVM